MTSVEMINKQANEMHQLGMVFIAIAVVFAIIAIILWRVLNISHSIKVVTGVGIDKELKKIKEEAKDGSRYYQNKGTKQIITWNTSGLLKWDKSGELEEKTTVLEEIDDSDMQTTVLDPKEYGFVIEEDIRIAGTDKSI